MGLPYAEGSMKKY